MSSRLPIGVATMNRAPGTASFCHRLWENAKAPLDERGLRRKTVKSARSFVTGDAATTAHCCDCHRGDRCKSSRDTHKHSKSDSVRSESATTKTTVDNCRTRVARRAQSHSPVATPVALRRHCDSCHGRFRTLISDSQQHCESHGL